MTRLVGKALGRGDVRPPVGQVIMPRKEDSVREYPSVGLTPSRLAGILREADEGSLSSAMHLFEQMEEKDAHLYSVANTRRLALTGLDWQILSAADVDERAARSSNIAPSVTRHMTQKDYPQRTQIAQRVSRRGRPEGVRCGYASGMHRRRKSRTRLRESERGCQPSQTGSFSSQPFLNRHPEAATLLLDHIDVLEEAGFGHGAYTGGESRRFC
ncbi:MAG: DUF935 family protein [Phycisphaerales bacterium]|nr:DUF935 family protein [Phycisphaerales bacterium]